MPPPAENLPLFQSWLSAHRGIVVKVARSFASSPADVKDLQQELLLQLWLSLPNFAGQAKPSTWIYRVCLNTALMFRRGAARRDRRLAPTCPYSSSPGTTLSINLKKTSVFL